MAQDNFSEFYSKLINKPGTVYSDGNNTSSVNNIDELAKRDVEGMMQGEYGAGVDLSKLPIEAARKIGVELGYEALQETQKGVPVQNILADAQSGWQQAKNAVARTLVNEMVLGSIKGISDLFDFTIGGGLFKTLNGETNDYSNPVSQYLEELQKSFEDSTPIYTKKGSNITDPDFGWWMSNIPSIASSFALMIPAKGLTAGIGALNKLAKSTKFGRYANGASRRFLTKAVGGTRTYQKLEELGQYGAEGLAMRIGENYQEARQTYNEMLDKAQNTFGGMSYEEYQKYVDSHKEILGDDIDYKDRNEVAKRVASNAAKETFKDDMTNAVFDVWQLWGIDRFNRFMKAPISGKQEMLSKLQAKFPNANIETLEKALADRTTREKFWDTAKSTFKGIYSPVAAELSEGVEESINYVAQKEGVSYGELLLNKELSETELKKIKDENSPLPFSKLTMQKLADYAKNPELWDSALWGVIGGIAFGKGAEAAQNVYVKGYLKDRKKKELEEAGASDEQIKNALKAYENPGYERFKMYINGRAAALDIYKKQDEQLNKGINPYNPNETLDVNDTEKVQRLKTRNREDYETGILLNSMTNGYWDLSKAFLASEELGQKLVDEGVLTQEELADRKEHIEQLAASLENKYNNTMDVIENALIQINDDEPYTDPTTGEVVDLSNVPVELLEIIARENIQHQIAIERLDKEAAQLRGEIESELKNDLKAKGIAELGFSPETLIRTAVQSKYLGQLLSEYKELKDSKQAATVGGQRLLESYENKINLVRNQLRANTETLGDFARYVNAMAVAHSHKKTIKDGVQTYDVDTELAQQIDDAILKGDGEFLQELGVLTEEDVARMADMENYATDMRASLTVLANNYRRLYGEEPVSKYARNSVKLQNLKDISEKLYDNYHTLFTTELLKANEESDLVLTKNDVLYKLEDYNNQITDTARYNLIEVFTTNLQKIAKDTNNPDGVIQELDNISKGLAKGEFYQSLDDTQKSILDEAAKIMNLSATINNNLKRYVTNAIRHYNIVNFTTQNSTTNKKPQNSSQNSKQDNSPLNIQKINTSDESSQNEGVLPVTETKKAKIIFSIDNDTKPTISFLGDNDTDNTAITTTLPNEDGNSELKLDKNTPDFIKQSKELFGDTATNNRNATVTKNPIIHVNDDGTFDVVEQGVIKEPTPAPAFRKNSATTANPEDVVLRQQKENSSGEIKPNEVVLSPPTGEEEETLVEKIGRIVMETVGKEGKYDYLQLAENIGASLQGENNNDELHQLVNRTLKWRAKLAKRQDIEVIEASEEEVDNAVTNAISAAISYSSLLDLNLDLDTKAKDKIKEIIDNAVDRIIQDYVKEFNVEKVNGKYAISKEALTALYNALYNNSTNQLPISDLYDLIVDKLNNDDKYVIIDKGVSKETIMQSLTSGTTIESVKNKYLERFGNSTTIIIKKQKEIVNAAIDTEIDYEKQIDGNQTGVNFFINNKKFGEIPTPKLDNTSKKWYMTNLGWITDIPTNAHLSNDAITNSNFLNFVKALIVPNNDTDKELQRLYNEALVAEENIADKIEEFIDAVKKYKSELLGKIDSNINTFNHIVNILNYANIIAAMSDNITEAKLRSVDDWGRKLSSSYQHAYTLRNSDKHLTVKIANITSQIPKITRSYNPISTAIGKNTKMFIGVVDMDNLLTINLSDGTTISNKYLSRRGTPVVVIREGTNEEIIYTKARTLQSTKNIANPLYDKFESLILNWQRNDNDDGTEINNFIRSLVSKNLSDGSTNIPLFRGAYIVNTNAGFAINFDNGSVLYFNDRIDTETKKILLRSKKGKTIVNVTEAANTILSLQYNITSELLNDNIDSYGISGYENGKFVIKIDDNVIVEYDSVQDFIVDNDVIDVKTESENDSNFVVPKDSISVSYKIISDDIVVPTAETSPVEEKVSSERITTLVGKLTEELNKNFTVNPDKTVTLLDNNKNTSKTLITTLIKAMTDGNKSMLNILKNSRLFNEFLNKNVIFAGNYDSLYIKTKDGFKQLDSNARALYFKEDTTLFDEKGNEILKVPAGSVTVLKQWFDLINNGDDNSLFLAARDIIHESIHGVLNNASDEWKTEAKKLYDYVRNILETRKVSVVEGEEFNDNDWEILERFTNYDNVSENTAIEEMIVESFTRPQFMNTLNKIDASENIGAVKIKENLLQKILKLLVKLFDININKNSLLQKEYELFSNVGKKENPVEIEITENTNEEEVDEDEENETRKEKLNRDIKLSDDDEDAADLSSKSDVQITSFDSTENQLVGDTRKWFKKIKYNGLITIIC